MGVDHITICTVRCKMIFFFQILCLMEIFSILFYVFKHSICNIARYIIATIKYVVLYNIQKKHGINNNVFSYTLKLNCNNCKGIKIKVFSTVMQFKER